MERQRCRSVGRIASGRRRTCSQAQTTHIGRAVTINHVPAAVVPPSSSSSSSQFISSVSSVPHVTYTKHATRNHVTSAPSNKKLLYHVIIASDSVRTWLLVPLFLCSLRKSARFMTFRRLLCFPSALWHCWLGNRKGIG